MGNIRTRIADILGTLQPRKWNAAKSFNDARVRPECAGEQKVLQFLIGPPVHVDGQMDKCEK